MSEEANRSRDDRKASSAAAPSGGKKVVIKSADMKEDMQLQAIDIAIAAYEKHGVEKDVAEYIKKEFDNKHGPTWHCIVGKNFDLPYDCSLELLSYSEVRKSMVRLYKNTVSIKDVTPPHLIKLFNDLEVKR